MVSYSPEIVQYIRNLVGQISESDLQHVDCYISKNMSIFIPITGHCGYALKQQHTHPAYSFILFPSKEQCLKNLADQFVSGHYLIEAMSPDIPHQEEVSGNFKRYFAMLISREFFEYQYSSYFNDQPGPYHGETFPVDPEIMLDLKSFMSEYEGGYPGCEENLAALTLIITHKLIRSQYNLLHKNAKMVEIFSIENIITYMHQHFEEQIEIAHLSEIANLSPSHFYRVFKKETRQTPMNYLNNIRLDKAKKLLRSGNQSITETALQCGFNSTSHFSTCFSKHFGISPSKYRSNYIPAVIK